MYRNEPGKGRLGLSLTLIVVAVGIYVGITVFPIYYNAKQFEGELINEGIKAGARFYSDELILSDILLLAKGFEIPLKKENVRISRFGEQVEVAVECDLPIQFWLVNYTYTWHFVAKTKNRLGLL